MAQHIYASCSRCMYNPKYKAMDMVPPDFQEEVNNDPFRIGIIAIVSNDVPVATFFESMTFTGDWFTIPKDVDIIAFDSLDVDEGSSKLISRNLKDRNAIVHIFMEAIGCKDVAELVTEFVQFGPLCEIKIRVGDFITFKQDIYQFPFQGIPKATLPLVSMHLTSVIIQIVYRELPETEAQFSLRTRSALLKNEYRESMIFASVCVPDYNFKTIGGCVSEITSL